MNRITLQCSTLYYQRVCYRQADSVQHLLQGFGFEFGFVVLAVAASPPGRGALVRQEVDIDELKGAHFVVELPCPGPNRGLLDDVDDVSFLQER